MRWLHTGRTITQTLAHGKKKTLTISPNGTLLSITTTHPAHTKFTPHSPPSLRIHILERTLYHARHTFLPAGYPHAVGCNYDEYIGWQAIHHMASACNGVLAGTFLLYGVGLGQGAAPATAGAINWALKDGFGQLGTLYFGKRIAPRFDAFPKTWYLSASLLLDIAVGLEIMTFVGMAYFLVIGSVANMLKGLAWMAGGSTRSAFNVGFTKNGRGENIADLTAKVIQK